MDALDGLRGLALLITLSSHMSNHGFLQVPDMRGSGKPGLFLFFALSAFLLCDALMQRGWGRLGSGRLWANFAARRCLRIWPLYLVVLLLSWALTLQGVTGWHYQLDTAALIRHLALVEGQSVFWSIPVEFKFYIWLPLVAVTLAWINSKGWPFPPVALAFVGVLAALAALWPPSQAPENSIQLRWSINVFLLGGMAAYVHRRHGSTLARFPRAWTVAGLAALCAWAVTVPSVWSALTGQPFYFVLNHRWFTFYGVVWTVLLLAVLHGAPWLAAIFSLRVMRYLGVVSFSAYLWHMPILDAFTASGTVGGGSILSLAFLCILAVATASYLLIELPCRGVYLRQSPRT